MLLLRLLTVPGAGNPDFPAGVTKNGKQNEDRAENMLRIGDSRPSEEKTDYTKKRTSVN